MKAKYIILTILAMVVYCAAAYYVGERLIDIISFTTDTAIASVYWIVYIGLSISYVVGRIGQFFFPGHISNWFIKVGAYWLGLFFYLFLGWGIRDAVLYGAILLGLLPYGYAAPAITNWLIIIAAGIVFLWGIKNARSPRLRQYSIHINKFCAWSGSELHIVAVADTHLGLLIGKERLEALITQINRLRPDLVLLPGDILDENVGTFFDEGMDQSFQKLKPPLGIFACLGSHEYILGHPEKALQAMAQAGITVLKDDVVTVADSIYIAGRDDFYKLKLTDHPRKDLKVILKGCDHTRPIILLDHYPSSLTEAQQCGVDLQLSGHTHNGQVFPLNLITHYSFELDAGYRRKGNFHVIVSAGYGIWLLPLRVGTTPELISIRLTFKKQI